MQFSVIVPTRDRSAMLSRCLAALAAQDFPAEDFEVLVVDDGSREPVRLPTGTPLQLRLFRQDQRGPAAARNHALRTAAGEFAVLTDDDCRPAENWLREFRNAFAEDRTAAWGGQIEPAPENAIWGDASQMLISYLYSRANRRDPFFCSNNLAFPRRSLQELGGFDEDFPRAAAEDRDLCDRWVRRFPIRSWPAARVVHQQNLGPFSFCRQHFHYGRGAFWFHERRAGRGEPGVQLESGRFYSNLLRYPWQFHRFPAAAVFSALLAVSQFATAGGYFYERLPFGRSQMRRR